jgi:phage tail sheath protein FI
MREWLHPGIYVQDSPWRPEPITAVDTRWQTLSPRRIPAYVEASIRHGLQWVVFEPNAEPTWADVRKQVGDFLSTVWHEGHLQGNRPDEAYFVRVDRSTMTQDDIDNGRLVALIGLATVKPAEFVVIRIGMWTADDQQPDQHPDRDPDDD